MSEVYLDQELVTFEGPEPETVGKALEVMRSYIVGQGRVVEGILIDGQDLVLGALSHEDANRSFEKVIIRTARQEVYWLGKVEMVLEGKVLLNKKVREFGGKLLSEPSGGEALARGLLEEVLELVGVMDGVYNLGKMCGVSWQEVMKRLLEQYQQVLNDFTSAMALGDVICQCDIVKEAFEVIVAQGLDILKGEVEPWLKQEVKKHEMASC